MIDGSDLNMRDGQEFAEAVCDLETYQKREAMFDRTLVWIRKNLKPDDVFEEAELIKWAEANGYEARDDPS